MLPYDSRVVFYGVDLFNLLPFVYYQANRREPVYHQPEQMAANTVLVKELRQIKRLSL